MNKQNKQLLCSILSTTKYLKWDKTWQIKLKLKNKKGQLVSDGTWKIFDINKGRDFVWG